MQISILCVGRLKKGPEQELVDRFEKRIKAQGPGVGIQTFKTIELLESKKNSKQERKKQEANQLIAKLPKGAFVIALDEKGKQLATQKFAATLKDKIDGGTPHICFLIGGADGLYDKIFEQVNLKLSLSDMTLPHMLARLFLNEQIYRAITIWLDHPYHRD